MARCTATTGTAATGRVTAAADGSPQPSQMPVSSVNNRHVPKERSGPKTSTPRAVMAEHEWAALEWAEADGVSPADTDWRPILENMVRSQTQYGICARRSSRGYQAR